MILKIPPSYLERINFGVMDKLETLEICTDLLYSGQSENPLDSELSGVASLSGQESDSAHCRGIDYSKLQLPQTKPLRHLIVKYLMKRHIPPQQHFQATFN